MDFGFDLLHLTLEEAWALRDWVRQHQQYGQEWDQDFMRRVHGAIFQATEAPNHDASLMVTEPELWQIDRQIPSALVVGGAPVGREILMKCMRLLQKMGEEQGEDSDVRRESGHYTNQEPGSGADTPALPG